MTVSVRGSLAASTLFGSPAGSPRPGLVVALPSPFADPGRLLTQTLDAIDDGLVVTDERAIVLHANRAARSIFEAGLLTQRNGLLCAGTPEATRTLHDAIARQDRARIPVILWFGTPSARQLATVTVRSAETAAATAYGAAHPVVVVTIRRATPARLPSAETLQAAFALTPAEARLAREVLKGDGVSACARRLGVTANTARTHLNRVFDKTGTKRQAELVRLLLGCQS